MDFDYRSVIDFSKLKKCIEKKRTTSKYLAQDIGVCQTKISDIMSNRTTPLTDVVARIAFTLGVPVSEIVDLKEIEPNGKQQEWFSKHEMKYKVPEDAKGELTYAPLWELIEGFLTDVNREKKDGEKLFTADDIFNGIVPPRKKIGAKDTGVVEAWKARGYDDIEKLKTRKRTTVGLSPLNRTKLKNNRSMSMRTIYEICKKLGCSVDWVLSYK